MTRILTKQILDTDIYLLLWLVLLQRGPHFHQYCLVCNQNINKVQYWMCPVAALLAYLLLIWLGPSMVRRLVTFHHQHTPPPPLQPSDPTTNLLLTIDLDWNTWLQVPAFSTNTSQVTNSSLASSQSRLIVKFNSADIPSRITVRW